MKCMKNEGFRNLTNEETLDLGQKSNEESEGFEFEEFWSDKREKLSREIEEMRSKIAKRIFIGNS